MANVVISVNGRTYTVSCDEGQEDRLRQLAGYLDVQVTRLSEQVGQVGDARLFLMAGLMVADELSETLERLKSLEDEVNGLKTDRDSVTGRLQAAESRAATALDGAAHRIEAIVRRIDAAQPAPSER
ncbi:MAG: cell division protein ZapA [Pseudomonadota bacterium]